MYCRERVSRYNYAYRDLFVGVLSVKFEIVKPLHERRVEAIKVRKEAILYSHDIYLLCFVAPRVGDCWVVPRLSEEFR
jgi:hypothetical protein